MTKWLFCKRLLDERNKEGENKRSGRRKRGRGSVGDDGMEERDK